MLYIHLLQLDVNSNLKKFFETDSRGEDNGEENLGIKKGFPLEGKLSAEG